MVPVERLNNLYLERLQARRRPPGAVIGLGSRDSTGILGQLATAWLLLHYLAKI